jgi:hypothetical protein
VGALRGATEGLSPHLIEETVTAVGEFEPEFRQAMTDPTRFGLAKSLVTAMMREGVDVTCQAEVQRWVKAFNERPESERRNILE